VIDGEAEGMAVEGLTVGRVDGNAGVLVGMQDGIFEGRLVRVMKEKAVGTDEGSLVGSSVGTHVG